MKRTMGFLATLILIFGLGVIDSDARQTTTKQTTTTTKATSIQTSSQQTTTSSNNGRRRRVRRHRKAKPRVNYGRRTRGTKTINIKATVQKKP